MSTLILYCNTETIDMKVFIHIPCPTYLRKFVEISFGENYELNHTDWLGILVLGLLQKKSHPTYHYAGQKKVANYSDKLQLNFTIHQANKNGFFLVNSDETKIVKGIDDVFRTGMYRAAVLNQENFGIEYKTTITTYLDAFNITEEELSYETIRKDFNRLKENFITN